MNKKGIGGFMESMFAMMTVMVALTAFLMIIAYTDTTVDDREVNVSFLDELYVSNGKICGLKESSLFILMEKERSKGMDVRLDVIGDVMNDSLEYHCGERTDHPMGRTGTVSLDSDDGRTLLARYEVVYWS